jgi:hypothetical protein
MSLSKTVLVAVGAIFALTTVAGAAPRQMPNDTTYSTSIPGKTQQDKFTVSN